MKLVILSALLAASVLANPLLMAPPDQEQPVEPNFDVFLDTRFLLYTRFNPTIPQQLFINNMASVTNSHFSAARPTRILIHGWQSDHTSDINVLTTAGYLRSYDVNVIVVDWAIGANTINYISSRLHVPNVGAHVASFLDTMLDAGFFIDYSRISIVGHSLGAHIAGFVGKRVTRGRINTIIGLDPAGPLFDAGNPTTRLDGSDAEYVEAIHTDISNLGIGDPIAQVDFYPNGGTGMPGCLTSICDHNIVVDYFVESLNSDRLWGRRCTNVAEMHANGCNGHGASMGGEPSNFRNNINGIFRFATNANSPFGQGPF